MDTSNPPDDTVETTLALADGTRYTVPPAGLTIGRQAGNDLVLTDPLVSRRHAVLFFRDGKLQVADLGSFNGTLVNGVRLAPEQEHVLQNEDVLDVGDTRLTLRIRRLTPSIPLHAVPVEAASVGGVLVEVAPEPAPPSAVIPLAEPENVPAGEAGPAPRLVITVAGPAPTVDSPAARLALRGVLDIETADQFREFTHRLLDAGADHFTLMLGELEYLDSSGLGAIVALLREVKPRDGTVVLQELQPAVRSIMELTRLDHIFTIT